MSHQISDSSSQNSIASTGKGLAEPQFLLQSLQSVLKQIDEEYEREHTKLSQTLPDASVKTRVLAMLKERHLERRQPYVQHLAILRRVDQ